MFRQVGPKVEDGEEDVDLLLLGEEVGGGLAGPHLVRGQGEVSDVVLGEVQEITEKTDGDYRSELRIAILANFTVLFTFEERSRFCFKHQKHFYSQLELF